MTADHYPKLALPINTVWRDSRNEDRLTRMRHRRAWWFGEHVRKGLLSLGLGSSARQRAWRSFLPGTAAWPGSQSEREAAHRQGRSSTLRADQSQSIYPGIEVSGKFVGTTVGRQKIEQILGRWEK